MNGYYIIDASGNQVGPITELLFAKYGVTRETLVWREGMKEWQQAGTLPELSHIFEQLPPSDPYINPCTPGQQGQFYANNPNTSCNPNQTPAFCPPTYLAWAILTTVLCCVPFGVVSIVYASQVSSKWAMGDVEGAFRSSRMAKNWAIAAAASALVILVIYMIVILGSIFVL